MTTETMLLFLATFTVVCSFTGAAYLMFRVLPPVLRDVKSFKLAKQLAEWKQTYGVYIGAHLDINHKGEGPALKGSIEEDAIHGIYFTLAYQEKVKGVWQDRHAFYCFVAEATTPTFWIPLPFNSRGDLAYAVLHELGDSKTIRLKAIGKMNKSANIVADVAEALEEFSKTHKSVRLEDKRTKAFERSITKKPLPLEMCKNVMA